MFKQLRNRLLIMNMSFITIIMITAFSVTYFSTWQQIQVGIDKDLEKITDFRDADLQELPPRETPFVEESSEGFIPRLPADRGGMERDISFSLLVNTNGEIISVNSFYDEDDTFYEEAIAAASQDGKAEGACTFGDSRWAYVVTERFGSILYGFVDIDERMVILDRLLITSLGVAAGAFLVILLISFFLTQRSLRPTHEAFLKQKEFISSASHELKTPLAVISANTELLLDGEGEDSLSSQQKRRLEYTKLEVERMSGLTRDLLFLARLDEGSSGSMPIQVPFDLSDSLESHLLGMEGMIFERGHSLEYEIAPDLQVRGIREQIIQVVTILIDNAVKYGEPGSPVSLELSESGGKVNLSVMNIGEGIPEDEIPKIFDRFYRGDAARDRSQSSHGLGLSIASTIITQHRGGISCRSEAVTGGKTTFTIRLPLSR